VGDEELGYPTDAVDFRRQDDLIMSMYLSNAHLGPVGAEAAEFIDYPNTFQDLAAEGRIAEPPPPSPSSQIVERSGEDQAGAVSP
jgi:hypothetical protein